MRRDILLWPHPLLKQKAAPVLHVDARVRALVEDLFETMYAAEGVGLAATQVGVLERVLVLDTTSRQPHLQPLAMVNPVIVAEEGEQVYAEGCLSLPGEVEDVARAAVVTVRYLDLQGQEQSVRCEGLLSVAVQHELDHLDGIVFVDHVSVLKRELIRRRMKRRQAEREPRTGT
ncbi:peptide deformylase [Aggregicoccus sp. 17bor-14]|uniref:peptide deformylase n=1 Tax=Myxococcaceae TaxID=31 RepID=UPI00129D1A5F|nr:MULTISPECIES: peptide deformylase [Myxococcaceae]MBF5043700.1 peptide deformylase [Simulacricoccus sp. 17bor-14]MRI89456.1 peptide deformylase [Aggregicoccus sp. 17bor-14]